MSVIQKLLWLYQIGAALVLPLLAELCLSEMTRIEFRQLLLLVQKRGHLAPWYDGFGYVLSLSKETCSFLLIDHLLLQKAFESRDFQSEF